jgi:BioD-like phosphotransacetylase family protein
MPVICISSSNKSVGKTTILSGIVHESIKRGLKTFVGKLDNSKIVTHDELSEILNNKENLTELSQSEIVFVEINNISDDEQIKFLNQNDAKIIFVENDVENLKNLKNIYEERLIGFIVNGVWKYQKNVLIQDVSNRELSKEILAVLDQDRFFMSNTIENVSKSLTTKKIIGEYNLNKIIENYLIGGFILDWGPEYFSSKENVALIVRGDRPDLQLSAIQSETIAVIIATTNITPVEYVIHEAKRLKIPILIIEENTEEAIEKLSDSIDSFKFDHNDKILHSNQILNKNLNFDSLFETLLSPLTK